MSKPGEVWKCNDTDEEECLYMVIGDKHGRIVGEVWLHNGEVSCSRGHSQGKPDKHQEFVAESLSTICVLPYP